MEIIDLKGRNIKSMKREDILYRTTGLFAKNAVAVSKSIFVFSHVQDEVITAMPIKVLQ